MNEQNMLDGALRAKLISDPGPFLEDPEVLRAFAQASAPGRGEGQSNIVDFRGLAMKRLEDRMSRLEALHSEVLAASWDRIAATEQLHRAILHALSAKTISELAETLNEKIAPVLKLKSIKLMIGPGTLSVEPPIMQVGPGVISAYAGVAPGEREREIVQRQVDGRNPAIFGKEASEIQSEAVIQLHKLVDLPFECAALLASADARTYSHELGNDLLNFFGDVLARILGKLAENS